MRSPSLEPSEPQDSNYRVSDYSDNLVPHREKKLLLRYRNAAEVKRLHETRIGHRQAGPQDEAEGRVAEDVAELNLKRFRSAGKL